MSHDYLSTACLHAEADGRPELHDYCEAMAGYQGAKRPAQCKFCDARCTCSCHVEAAAGEHHEITDVALALDDTCVHCGRAPAAGYAKRASDRLCHPDKPAGEPPGVGELDCYRLVTVYREEIGARRG